MTIDALDLGELEERHTCYSEDHRYCTCCEAAPWPCEVIRLVAEVRKLRTELMQLGRRIDCVWGEADGTE